MISKQFSCAFSQESPGVGTLSKQRSKPVKKDPVVSRKLKITAQERCSETPRKMTEGNPRIDSYVADLENNQSRLEICPRDLSPRK